MVIYQKRNSKNFNGYMGHSRNEENRVAKNVWKGKLGRVDERTAFLPNMHTRFNLV